jgi:isocitrate dehydrogenase (NAD+)
VAHRIVLIAGDGIGPEVAAATRLVLDAVDVGIDWVEMPAGASALETHGALLPDETLDAIRTCRVAIKGPITTPVGTGFRSVNVALRQDLDLFAAVRPARSLPGVRTRHEDVDLVIVRENTEDLYQGIEFERGSDQAAALRATLHDIAGIDLADDAGVTLKPISVTGAHRISRFAFEYARTHARKHVTVGHKANVMRYSDGIFLQAALEDAPEYPDIAFDEIQIDHLSARLARSPQDFDVLLLPNLYGDIISDLSAGLVGGLGLIPGANIGWEYAVFEAVHGSAPDIAGQQKANPVAMILSGAMMLRHLGEMEAADNVEWGVDETLRKGDIRTPDLGGDATTMAFAEAIAAEAVAWEHGPS